MRKNRKRTKVWSVAAVRSMHFGAVIMMLFVMVLVNMRAKSQGDQIQKMIGERENLLAKLEQDRERESGRWGQMNTPENLDRILTKLGMSMKYPRAEQIVRIDARGVPEPGQISVARAARRRASETAVASNGAKIGSGKKKGRR